MYVVVSFEFDAGYNLRVDELARNSAVRNHGEFDGPCGDVDRRCGKKRITYTHWR